MHQVLLVQFVHQKKEIMYRMINNNSVITFVKTNRHGSYVSKITTGSIVIPLLLKGIVVVTVTAMSMSSSSSTTSTTKRTLFYNSIVSNKSVPGLKNGMDYIQLGDSDLIVSKICCKFLDFV
jgi:hypothetical protein